MKLRYFLAPHDLLDESTGKLMPCTVGNVAKHDLGFWVTIGLEKSETARLLPIMSTVANNDMPLNGSNRCVQKNTIVFAGKVFISVILRSWKSF
jgi:hypothetical protein